jgi:hypothetical protein
MVARQVHAKALDFVPAARILLERLEKSNRD